MFIYCMTSCQSVTWNVCVLVYHRKDAFVGSETKQEGLQLELASLLYNIG